MTMPKKIAVLGFMANCPIAGVIWQHIHYIVGLQRLGHEVYYIEDTSRYPYDPVQQTPTDDYSYAAGILGRLAEEFGFKDRWAFCPRYKSLEETAGMSRRALLDLYGEADAMLNICGSHELNDDLLRSERLIYVESDPAVEQIKVDKGEAATTEFLSRHCARFTFGENIGRAEFPVPLHGIEWLPTRQPVVTDYWRAGGPPPVGARFSSIANLATGGKKDIEWRGEHYLWSKLPEFEKCRPAPGLAGEGFELATSFKDRALGESFLQSNWRIVSPDEISVDYRLYVDYIRQSKGEFTVAKDQYVRLNTGWFSDRSACYLAAGRPVITQETGFTRLYGGKEGLLAFTNLEEIVEAVRRINSDYPAHCRAAEELAREFFEAETVLRSLLERVGI
jgi:hypothetical protein